MKALSLGDRIRTGTYSVRARYRRSLLLAGRDGRLLFLVDRSIGPGPLNIVVARPERFLPGDSFRLPPWPAAPRFDSSLPRLDRTARARLTNTLQAALPRHAPPDSLASLITSPGTLPPRQAARNQRIRLGLKTISSGQISAGVRLLRGCGEGLTPAGDDCLCGLMLAARLLRRPALARSILPHALGGNPVSNAFLKLSAEGRVNIAVQRLLQAPSPARVQAVCAFGHSSGADLLCGLLWGLNPFPEPLPPPLNPEP
ncbi:MAG: DUF2877 domain-containing protein [Kiritimatiellae bacterium]|nr:DUF2877 domain-containing protein [Kiritimatiellia bacterium]